MLLISILGVILAISIIIHTNYIKIERHVVLNKGIKCKIAHISDIHGKLQYLNGTLSEILNKQKIDFLIVTGDLAENVKDRQKVLEELKRIKVAEKIYLVLGNYEREQRVGIKKRALDITSEEYHQLGTDKLKVLINEYDIYTDVSSGKKILFYGFDNSIYGNERYSEEVKGMSADIKIVFAHSPNIIKYIERQEVSYDMLLVGHTHGNQMNIPILNKLNRSYAKFHVGYKVFDDKIFNISRGLGTSKIPIRINARPQITIFDIE
ncbi:MAG: metallophosphoesterase [Cellulosilyticaceae bacterium]